MAIRVADGGLHDDDRRILNDLARHYGPSLRRFFQRRAGPGADVDDLVQETFVRLANRANLEITEPVEGYIFQVAKSVLIDKARRSAVRTAANEIEQNVFERGDEGLSPERVFLEREALELAVKALFELPERTRVVFILHRFEHLQYREIAKRLGVSISTVEKDIMKALVHIGSVLGAD